MRLPSLHKGYWIFQSPRILIILMYLRNMQVPLENIVEIVKSHIDYVNKIVKSYEKKWILERLNKLGYEPKSRAKDVEEILQKENIIDYYINRLGINQQIKEKLINYIQEVLKILRTRNPIKAVAYLPPELTIAEKVLLLDALSRSESFDLKTSLEVVLRSWFTGKKPLELMEGDRHSCAREFRFRYTYLTCLGLITGEREKPRPTSLGFTTYEAIRERLDPTLYYLRNLVETERLEKMLTIDIASLDIMDRETLDKYIELTSKIIRNYIEDKDIMNIVKYKLTSLVSYLPSDSRNITVILMIRDIYSILKTLEI